MTDSDLSYYMRTMYKIIQYPDVERQNFIYNDLDLDVCFVVMDIINDKARITYFNQKGVLGKRITKKIKEEV